MAVDVGAGVVVAIDEAVVKVLSVPASVGGRGLAVLLHVVVVEQEAAIVGAVGDEVGDSAVGEGGGGKASQESKLRCERHCELLR